MHITKYLAAISKIEFMATNVHMEHRRRKEFCNSARCVSYKLLIEVGIGERPLLSISRPDRLHLAHMHTSKYFEIVESIISDLDYRQRHSEHNAHTDKKRKISARPQHNNMPPDDTPKDVEGFMASLFGPEKK